MSSDMIRPSAVRRMKNFVNYLGDHPWARRPFFAGGFFTVRLLYPVQYLVLRELLDCESVLDLGCGNHSMVPILPSGIRKVGVELYKPYYEESLKKGRHDQLINADVTQVNFPDKSFDAVVLLDVIEHLPKAEGKMLLQKMQRWARKKVVVFTPNGFLHQDDYDDNPYMEHRSGWEAGEMRGEGFRVYGVRGFKVLKKDSFEHSPEKWSAIDGLADLTQVVTYHVPSWAFQIFCVKKVGDG